MPDQLYLTVHEPSRWADFLFFPYELPDGRIVFDDPKLGLKDEEFVCGADNLIRRLAPSLPCMMLVAANGNEALLEHALEYVGTDENDWSSYRHVASGELVGLCPNFLRYYPKPPKTLRVSFRALSDDDEPSEPSR